MSQTVVALPRFIELRSVYNKQLLRYVKEEGVVKGFVQFSGEHVGSADTKFEVHDSTAGNGLVHIRSCYNNKYLQVLDDDIWTVAKAEKPEEDQSKRSCTLLRPTSVDGNPNKIRLTNVHFENNLCMWGWPSAEPYHACVVAYYSDPEPDFRDVFDVIDWQSLVLLPKYVAFKGDNDKFLRAWQAPQNYLQFSLDRVEDRLVGNEIVQTPDGNICIRNMHWDRYWRLSPNPHWIWADSTDTTSNDTLFEAVKSVDDKIALRNVANKFFCTRLTRYGSVSCLNAGTVTTINSYADLKVSEFVASRKIENIKFRLMDARIYGESIVQLALTSHTNEGNTTQEWESHLSYKEKTSTTWNNNISIKASIDSSFTAGLPLIEEGEIKLGPEVAGDFMWGETKQVENDRSISFQVRVPPKTKVTTRLVSTRGTCDVPFNYTQRDVLYFGGTVTTEMDDGLYTGVNNYSYFAEVKEEPLITDPNVPAQGFKKVAKVSPSGEITPI